MPYRSVMVLSRPSCSPVMTTMVHRWDEWVAPWRARRPRLRWPLTWWLAPFGRGHQALPFVAAASSRSGVAADTPRLLPGRRRAALAAAMVGALAVVLTLLTGGCGGSAPAPASATATPGELTFDQARDQGLLRDDAVSVSAPAELVTGGRPRSVTVTVTVPVHMPERRIEMDWSGDCTLLNDGRPMSIDIPAGAWRVSATGTISVPTGQSTCFVQVDALFPGRPYTGAGATITVRP